MYTMVSGGTGCVLYVDDSGSGTGGAQEALVSGFKTATGLGTGTGQFPTTSQMTSPSGAVVIRKSASANSTVRYWTTVCDGHSLYLFCETGDSLNGTSLVVGFPFVFGDFFSYNASDTNNCQIVGRTGQNTSSANYEWLSVLGTSQGGPGLLNIVAPSGHYVAASWTGVGGSIQVGKLVDMGKIIQPSNSSTSGGYPASGTTNSNSNYGVGRSQYNGTFPYPNGADGALWMSPIWINHTYSIRGYMKGLWAPLHDRPLNHNDSFTVSGGNLNGKTFLVQNIPFWNTSANSDNGQILVETSNTWA
jgi:hypothetical protein